MLFHEGAVIESMVIDLWTGETGSHLMYGNDTHNREELSQTVAGSGMSRGRESCNRNKRCCHKYVHRRLLLDWILAINEQGRAFYTPENYPHRSMRLGACMGLFGSISIAKCTLGRGNNISSVVRTINYSSFRCLRSSIVFKFIIAF